jgi:hypothetical protein
MCTDITGSHSVYIKSYQIKILFSRLKSIDRMFFFLICKYSYQGEGTFLVILMSTYVHAESTSI